MTLWYLVKDHLRQLTTESYTALQWTLIRIFTILLWVYNPIYVIFKYNTQLYPEGICHLFDCSIITVAPINFMIIGIMTVAAISYILNRNMLSATFTLFLISLVLFTLERSNGIHHRRELYTLIFFAQFLAYLFNFLYQQKEIRIPLFSKPIHENAIQFSIQVLAAAYVVAAITKIQINGLNWVLDAPNFAIQMLKTSYWQAFDENDLELIKKGEALANWTLQHKLITAILFGGALLLELFAWVMVFSKPIAFYYGTLLFIFHLGIYYTLHIYLEGFANNVLIYCINTPWILAAPYIIFKRWQTQAVN